jgi:hypothetical protein
MPDSSPTAVVTGAGRGFGRAIATALVAGGVHVVGVARHEDALDAVRDDFGGLFTSVAGYATDDALAHDVIRRYRPGLLVLNAGAAPHMAPVHEQTWESFSRNWNTDTRHAFAWTRAALREPLAPGSVVVAMLSDSWPVTSCATGPVAPGADPRQRAARLRRPARTEAGLEAYGVQVITLIGRRIAHITAFNDPGLVPTFAGAAAVSSCRSPAHAEAAEAADRAAHRDQERAVGERETREAPEQCGRDHGQGHHHAGRPGQAPPGSRKPEGHDRREQQRERPFDGLERPEQVGRLPGTAGSAGTGGVADARGDGRRVR